MECIEQTFNGTPDFGRRATVTITRNGDLITKVYLMVRLERVCPSAELGAKMAWVRRLGHALIYSVEVEIGGSKIDKQYGVWLNIWYELARDPAKSKERGFAHMIGDVPELTTYDSCPKPEYIMYVPLKFWFNRHVGLALPLIALQYHEVRLNFEFINADHLIVANDQFRQNDMRQLQMKDAQLLVDYIYLDSEERRRFAQVGHEYLIEQLQYTGSESVQNHTGKYKLDFNHPTKELIWAVRNGHYITGRRFVYYTAKHWHEHLVDAATKILRESIALLTVDGSIESSSGEPCPVVGDDQKPEAGEWEEFCPKTTGCTTNGKIFVTNLSETKALWVSTNTLRIGADNLTDKICAEILVCEDAQSVYDVKITDVKTGITVRDLSFPVEHMEDTRIRRDDPHVHQFHNFGVLINGKGNPVQWALIQLNGLDRFDRREGPYFNYVQPDQHHTNTPADGINVYSFALHPEQHQPSGSCNLSRIDNTQLNLWFHDPTHRSGQPHLNIFSPDNKLYIYAFSYNVLKFLGRKSSQPKVYGYLLDKTVCHPINNKMTATSKIKNLATLSNCGKLLKLYRLSQHNKMLMAETKLDNSKNYKDWKIRSQVHCLNNNECSSTTKCKWVNILLA